MASRRSILDRLDTQAQLSVKGSATSNTGRGSTTVKRPPIATSLPPNVNPSPYGQVAGVTQPTLTPAPAGFEPSPWGQVLGISQPSLSPTAQPPSRPSSVYVGGGGGAGVTTPPPIAPTHVDPTQPPPPTGPGGSGNEGGSDLGRFTEQEIEAALAALEAQYGMTREQLLMDQTQLGAQARLLMARMERQRQLGVQAAEQDAVGRGIYRSGILGENVQGIENQYQEQAAQAEQQRLAQEQAIQTQLQFLQQQKAAQAAQVQAGILRSSADYANQAGVSAGQAGLAQAGGAAPYQQAQDRFIQSQLQGQSGYAPISIDPRYAPQVR